MDEYKPGEGIWSQGASSPQEPRAIWKLNVYPNGESDDCKENVSVYVYLTGPMVSGCWTVVSEHLAYTPYIRQTTRRNCHMFNTTFIYSARPKVKLGPSSTANQPLRQIRAGE